MDKTELAVSEQIIQLMTTFTEDQRAEILALVRQQVLHNPTSPTRLSEFLDLARQSRAELRAEYGEGHFNSQMMLDELREETSEWPRQL